MNNHDVSEVQNGENGIEKKKCSHVPLNNGAGGTF